MKQLIHELRASYVDTQADDQTLQNCFNHNITLQSPGNFTSGVVEIIGTQTHSASNMNYVYVTSDKEFRLVINGDEELIGRHFSIMNLETNFNLLFENVSTDPGATTSIKYLYGKVVIPEEE